MFPFPAPFDISHIHPMFVHFPIALIITGFALETFSLFYKKNPCLSTVGFILLLLGTLGAVSGYISGEFLTSEPKGTAGIVKEWHEVFAKISMFIAMAACVLWSYELIKKTGKPWIKWTVYVFYLLSAISVGIAGFLGGTIVYFYYLGG